MKKALLVFVILLLVNMSNKITVEPVEAQDEPARNAVEAFARCFNVGGRLPYSSEVVQAIADNRFEYEVGDALWVMNPNTLYGFALAYIQADGTVDTLTLASFDAPSDTTFIEGCIRDTSFLPSSEPLRMSLLLSAYFCEYIRVGMEITHYDLWTEMYAAGEFEEDPSNGYEWVRVQRGFALIDTRQGGSILLEVTPESSWDELATDVFVGGRCFEPDFPRLDAQAAEQGCLVWGYDMITIEEWFEGYEAGDLALYFGYVWVLDDESPSGYTLLDLRAEPIGIYPSEDGQIPSWVSENVPVLGDCTFVRGTRL